MNARRQSAVDDVQPETLIPLLREALAGPLPGLDAHLRMAPESRRGDPSQIVVDGKACREGGVLVLLYPRNGVVHLLLTVRTGELRTHGGQVSFPGGGCEPAESPRKAALREAYEECGIPPDRLLLLGELSPLYIPPSNFCIYPQVAFTPAPPNFQPHDAEVAALLEVPLSLLADPHTRREEIWDLRGERVLVPFYAVGGHKVWGATAMVLSELLVLLAEIVAKAQM